MQEKARIQAMMGEDLLFLTDDQLRRGIEAMFFAYRAFTADPDLILAELDYGRAHHRALHFVNRDPGLTVTSLLAVLGVTKQSLNRVLRTLTDARRLSQCRAPGRVGVPPGSGSDDGPRDPGAVSGAEGSSRRPLRPP